MARRKRRSAQIAGAREARAIVANLGREVRRTRRRRQLTQAVLAERVELSQSEISYLERGYGARTSLETWVAIGIALGRPIAFGLGRDVVDPSPRDAAHLRVREFVLNLAAAVGRRARFELPTRPTSPSWSVDVALEDRHNDALILVEIWNRMDDLGAAVRSTDRKAADLAGTAARIASCWVLVDTAANREIVRRYPAVLRARLPGSSAAWRRTLVDGASPPKDPGLVWADGRGSRLTALRLPASRLRAAR